MLGDEAAASAGGGVVFFELIHFRGCGVANGRFAGTRLGLSPRLGLDGVELVLGRCGENLSATAIAVASDAFALSARQVFCAWTTSNLVRNGCSSSLRTLFSDCNLCTCRRHSPNLARIVSRFVSANCVFLSKAASNLSTFSADAILPVPCCCRSRANEP